MNFVKRISVNNSHEKNSSSTVALFLLAAIALFLPLTPSVSGQNTPSVVDPTFNAQLATTSFGLKSITAIVAQPDGKFLVSGGFNSYNEQFTGGLVRLNANGTLDATFNNGLIKTGAMITRIVPMSNGKIIIAGNNFTFNNQTIPPSQIVRLNADGTVDSSFAYTNGGSISGIEVDANGGLAVRGSIPVSENGVVTTRGLVRLNPNGSLNTSFVYQLGSVQALTIQNNRVVIGVMDASQDVVVRLNENGSVDSSFTRKVLSNIARDIKTQPDNKILVLDNSQKLLRLNENGDDDSGFQVSTYPSPVFGFRLNADGKITLAYGNSSATGLRFVRLLPNGAVDSNFTQFTYFFIPGNFAVQPDGSIIIGDNAITGVNLSNAFVRLLPTGVQDTTFNSGGVAFQNMGVGAVRAIETQPNGKILIGGDFDKINGVSRRKLARLNADTTVDNSFQITIGGSGTYFTQFLSVFYIATQPDGKVLLSGSFTYVQNGVTKNDIVRLNEDGSIDSTFVLSVPIREFFTVNGDGKNKFTLLGNGKIFVGTSRIGIGTSVANPPIKLNSNGTVDTAFSPTFYNNENVIYINDLAVQPDGKILVAGKTTTKGFILRLNSDGSLDPTFTINEEAGKTVFAFALLPNGKILAVKGAGSFFSNLPGKIVRLNTDGSPDNSFLAAAGASGRINVLLVLANGKILVGGKFTAFDGQPRQNLALLSAAGELEGTSYNVNDEVLTLTADGEGRVFVGGTFTTINIGEGQDLVRSYVARVVNAPTPTRFDFDGDGKADLAAFTQADGIWSIFNRQTNQPATAQFGQTGDRTVVADFDGDGKTNLAVYRPSNGTWYIARATGVPAQNFDAIQFGTSSDRPVPADFDGDGKADIAVWRPSNGIWYIRRSGGNPSYFQFGTANDIPVPADYDGDGKADVAVFRPSNGTFYWLASGSNNQLKGVQFGTLGDIPAIADYNGDGKADLVVFRPSSGIWYQYLTTQSGAYTFRAAQFGQTGDEPVPADYDGDGKADIAVRRQGVWHLLNSVQGYSGISFGEATAQAVAALQN